MIEQIVQERVLSLHAQGKWQEIVEMCENGDAYEYRRLLWVWPTLDDLKWIKKVLEDHRLDGIISVGCGSGLLEWIIQQFSGCNVLGIENDSSWWSSAYSPPMFLKETIFVDENPRLFEFPTNHALFFCYFNNGAAFCDYLARYKGNVLIIIGPNVGLNRTTDPLPFDEKFERFGWKLLDTRKLDNAKDLVVVYTRVSRDNQSNFI